MLAGLLPKKSSSSRSLCSKVAFGDAPPFSTKRNNGRLSANGSPTKLEASSKIGHSLSLGSDCVSTPGNAGKVETPKHLLKNGSWNRNTSDDPFNPDFGQFADASSTDSIPKPPYTSFADSKPESVYTNANDLKTNFGSISRTPVPYGTLPRSPFHRGKVKSEDKSPGFPGMFSKRVRKPVYSPAMDALIFYESLDEDYESLDEDPTAALMPVTYNPTSDGDSAKSKFSDALKSRTSDRLKRMTILSRREEEDISPDTPSASIYSDADSASIYSAPDSASVYSQDDRASVYSDRTEVPIAAVQPLNVQPRSRFELPKSTETSTATGHKLVDHLDDLNRRIRISQGKQIEQKVKMCAYEMELALRCRDRFNAPDGTPEISANVTVPPPFMSDDELRTNIALCSDQMAGDKRLEEELSASRKQVSMDLDRWAALVG